MHPEWLALLPTWLVAGVVMGGVAAVVVAGIFVVGDRLFPSPSPRRGPRVDGTDRRRVELGAYLDRIGERYVTDARVHGENVAFYLPERDVAITFDAQAFFRLDGTDTHAVLCEHEMPSHHLGRRLPFEVAHGAWTAASTPTAAAFAHLGLPTDADAAEVRAAYRSRVKAVHPDHDGDPESFRRLQESYATAKEHAE